MSKVEKRKLLIEKTQSIISIQLDTKKSIQNTSIGLIGFIALISTITIVLLKESNFWIKVILFIPIFLAGYATRLLLFNLKRRALKIGTNTEHIKKRINFSFEGIQKFIINSNIAAIEENVEKIDDLGKKLDSGIKWLLYSISILVGLLIMNNFLPKNNELEKYNQNFKINIMSNNTKNDEKYLDEEKESAEEIYPIDPDSLMATEKEKNNKTKKR